MDEVGTGAWRGTGETSWRLPGSGLSVVGRSVAGAETRILFPELRCCFDAGLAPPPHKPTHLFITHTHADHSFALPYFLRRDPPPVQTFVPAEALDATRAFVLASQRLNGGDEETVMQRIELHGVRPGDVVRFGARWEARVVRCSHSVPCVGYAVSELREKLLPQLADLRGSEIAAMRKSGQTVSEVVRKPLFCFLGDTDDSIFDEHSRSRVAQESLDTIFACPVVFVECTYLGSPATEAAVSEARHVWWDRLRPVVEAHPRTTFVLLHFSERYKPAELRSFFARLALPNIFPWLPPNN